MLASVRHLEHPIAIGRSQPRPSAEGSGTGSSKNGPNILTRRLGMKINRGACQTRHGIEDVVSILLDGGVDLVGEVGVLVG
jgi:hypothetical protein